MANYYSDKLKDPRWQKKRLEIFERDDFRCTFCDDKEQTLHVHHLQYNGLPWDTPNEFLITLCEDCHNDEHFGRPEIEKELLKQLRVKGFSKNDLSKISDGFGNYSSSFIHEVEAEIIKWALSDSEITEELGNRYFEWLHSKNAHLLAEGEDFF